MTARSCGPSGSRSSTRSRRTTCSSRPATSRWTRRSPSSRRPAAAGSAASWSTTPGSRSSVGESEHAEQLVSLDARLEVGALADLLGTGDGGDGTTATEQLAASYPHELLVFGSDLGHTAYPTFEDGIDAWTRRMLGVFGEAELTSIMTKTGRELIEP